MRPEAIIITISYEAVALAGIIAPLRDANYPHVALQLGEIEIIWEKIQFANNPQL